MQFDWLLLRPRHCRQRWHYFPATSAALNSECRCSLEIQLDAEEERADFLKSGRRGLRAPVLMDRRVN